MEKVDVEKAMNELDSWVSKRGNGEYVPKNFVSPAFSFYGIPANFGIQQVRAEIKDFAHVIADQSYNHNTSALEVGLGYFGSTHFLWRQLFDKVTSIEKSHDRVRSFGENSRDFYNKWIADDGKSSFLIGASNDVSTLKKAYDSLTGGVDMLFIDGDHRYEGVMADWLLYNPLVGKGGIVAFHDANASVDSCGVPDFLEDLENGHIDGKNYELSKIIKSEDAGIAYYIKE
ncbi:class I SAM-dependent methyltransferase [Candidatus Pacearchaeota archaeon]|nr:class I SAM-dependent methyltransferase [Candidatus Pacearchaeota archaeon]